MPGWVLHKLAKPPPLTAKEAHSQQRSGLGPTLSLSAMVAPFKADLPAVEKPSSLFDCEQVDVECSKQLGDC